MFKLARVMACMAIIAGALLTTLVPASAHERRTVGAYSFVVGWKVEPAFSDANNNVQVTIKDASGAPVALAAGDMKVEVLQGTQKSDMLTLKSVFNSPGEYNAAVLPTRPGTYTFHFVGTIAGQKVDESFTSSDHTFGEMQNATSIEFPAKDPSRGEIAQNLTRSDQRAETQFGNLQGQLTKAQQTADLDRWLAIAGIALGVIGIAALAFVLLMERRRRQAGASSKVGAPSGATGE